MDGPATRSQSLWHQTPEPSQEGRPAAEPPVNSSSISSTGGAGVAACSAADASTMNRWSGNDTRAIADTRRLRARTGAHRLTKLTQAITVDP